MATDSHHNTILALEKRLEHLEKLLGNTQLEPTSSTRRTDLVEATQMIENRYKKLFHRHDSALGPYLVELEQVLSVDHSLLDDNLHQNVVPLETKIEQILQKNEQIDQILRYIEAMEDLQEYVNTPELENTHQHLQKLKPIELEQIEQSTMSQELELQVLYRIKKYNQLLDDISKKFVYWDHVTNQVKE
eukprot:TRINITY_DN3176_c2_g1_i1.p1 TRINITY_DN3176_c2_g1~~TRINITY_DN3176_c2_g1_i1.p1  ORF type:complete len:189 (+),score=46.01 TRINITY_DN3176_c2_g1_i1:1-567(+)